MKRVQLIKTTLASIILTTVVLSTVVLAMSRNKAKDQPASKASIIKLMEVNMTQKSLDVDLAEAIEKGVLELSSVADANTPLTEEEKLLTQDVTSIISKFMAKNLTWELLEPDYVKIYSERFTQQEIDAMIKFYQTKIGQSIAEKEFEADLQLAEVLEKRLLAIEPAMKRDLDAKLKDRIKKHK